MRRDQLECGLAFETGGAPKTGCDSAVMCPRRRLSVERLIDYQHGFIEPCVVLLKYSVRDLIDMSALAMRTILTQVRDLIDMSTLAMRTILTPR